MGYIKLHKDQLDIRSISEKIPFTTINSSQLHIDVCEAIAEKFFSYKDGSMEKKTLVNLLSSKSIKA